MITFNHIMIKNSYVLSARTLDGINKKQIYAVNLSNTMLNCIVIILINTI